MMAWEPIALAQDADLPLILAVFNRYPSQLIPISASQLATYHRKEQVYWDSGIAMIARMMPVKSYLKYWLPPDTWHLNMIASSRQRKGAADEFMVRFLWQTHGRIVLSVYPFNIRAIKFYKKHGFRKVGEYNWPSFTVDVYQHGGDV